ncbi:hypothetical protein ABZP36_021720 [Zizania latifolia]
MAPTVTMLESAAYERMRAEHPDEFVPKRVLLAHVDKHSEIDRGNSFWVKAALVYDTVTGDHVDDQSKTLSCDLLLGLADACCSRIHPPRDSDREGTAEVDESKREAAKDVAAAKDDAAKGTQHPDEGSDENKHVIDAIFLVVGFLPRLFKAMSKGDTNSRDAVDESFKSTHMQDIVTDVIKLENQLPLKLLLDVVNHVEAAARVAAGQSKLKKLQATLEGYQLGFKSENFDCVIRSFCLYYSPFFSNSKQVTAAAPGKDGPDQNVADTLLDCLHASLVPRAPAAEGGGGRTSRIPTARELRRSGVRLEAVEDLRAVVEFKEATATLRLPALVYDFKLATVARNLLAREYKEQSKPLTRYFQLMNELVEEVADVRIIRGAGVVRGGSKGAQEVHELIKKIDGYATYPSVFMAMDLQIEKAKQFHEKRMNNFFVRNRPAMIWASSVLAASVVAIITARKTRG